VEAPADLVVHAAVRHPVEGRPEHLQASVVPAQVAAEQELEGHGLWELGRATEASPPVVERPAQHIERPAQHIVRQRIR
jgi:hypothetical protein